MPAVLLPSKGVVACSLRLYQEETYWLQIRRAVATPRNHELGLSEEGQFALRTRGDGGP